MGQHRKAQGGTLVKKGSRLTPEQSEPEPRLDPLRNDLHHPERAAIAIRSQLAVIDDQNLPQRDLCATVGVDDPDSVSR